MTKYRVAIIDDEVLFVQGMKLILEQDDRLVIAHTGHDGTDLLDLVKSNNLNADIILLDLSMPVMDGVETLKALAKYKLEAQVIILTSHYNDGIILKMLDEGAAGFLAKNENPDEVVKTVLNVAQKGFYINDYILQLIRNRRFISKNSKTGSELSNREIEILRLICKELTNKEIASQLYLSPRTVEGHRNRMLEKTGSKNTAGLVIYAIEHNLVEVDISKYK